MLSAKTILVVMTALPLVTLFGSMPTGGDPDPFADISDDPATTAGESSAIAAIINPDDEPAQIAGGSFFKMQFKAVPRKIDAGAQSVLLESDNYGEDNLVCHRNCQDYSNTPVCSGTATPVASRAVCEQNVKASLGTTYPWKKAYDFQNRLPGCIVYGQKTKEKVYWNPNPNPKASGHPKEKQNWGICHCSNAMSPVVHVDDANLDGKLALDGSDLKCKIVRLPKISDVQASFPSNMLGLCWNTDGSQFLYPDTGENGALCSAPCMQVYGMCIGLGDSPLNGGPGDGGKCSFHSFGQFGTPNGTKSDSTSPCNSTSW